MTKKDSLNFGLDYDDTITREPEGFTYFCASMRALGHKVFIVTMRYPSECSDIARDWTDKVDGIIPTFRQAKAPAAEAVGVKIDVWIDDNPRAVNESATQIWGWCSPEGSIINRNTVAELPKAIPVQ